MTAHLESTAAKLLVTCLENEGFEYIFGIPGEVNIHFIDALRDSSIRSILTRHEQGASFMADIYGRLTGKAGVCSATLGPVAKGYRIQRAEELLPILQRALADETVSIIACPVDASENIRLTDELGKLTESI